MPTEQEILDAKILVVDDERTNVLLLEDVLGECGYTRVQSTLDPFEAVRLYADWRPDLLLLDLNMPKLDGFGVIQQLRAIERDDYLPILVLTAHAEDDIRLRALSAGAKDYLTKPFDPLDVSIRIRSILEVRLMHDEVRQQRQDIHEILQGMLPASVARDLIAKRPLYPSRYDDVTLMFTDFSGFAALSRELEPAQLVEELEVCFNTFDRIGHRNGLERVKTIGDGYMCVGGLHSERESHPTDCIRAAFQMQRFIQQRRSMQEAAGKSYWEMRIGINTGPVVAGVLGKTRISYDIWGPTVNLAKRMEEIVNGGEIGVSPSTFSRAQSEFTFHERGVYFVKNVGEVACYVASRET
ncbi:MAG: response regulator [Candidatus Poribacteria bacterium]|nr:response regulator [Candidatus Poribacteria bacterium]